MLEARLTQASILKKIVEVLKDLLTEGNFDCSDAGIALQSMDSSHVALISLLLRADAFDPYRCDRNMNLGINIANFSKLIKCAGPDDVITLKATDDGNSIDLVFESSGSDKMTSFSLKLMDIDAEHMGIPEDEEYQAEIIMSSSEFQLICRDLSQISDTVTIEASKEGVHFSAVGDTGSGCITIKQGSMEEKEQQEEEVDDVEMEVKEEEGDELPDEEELEDEDDEMPQHPKKKRKVHSSQKKKNAQDKEAGVKTRILLRNPVSLCFSLKYMSNFAKATPLAKAVKLSLSPCVPLVVEYVMNDTGHLRFFLAPKIEEE